MFKVTNFIYNTLLFSPKLNSALSKIGGAKSAVSVDGSYLKTCTPSKWIAHATWVNDTPHLTAYAARVHRDHIEVVDDMTGFQLMSDQLEGSAQLERALKFFKAINYDWQKAVDMLTDINKGALVRLMNMRDRLKKSVNEWKIDPTLGSKENLQATLDECLKFADKLANSQLAKFEKKMALKYASNQNIRSVEVYMKNAREAYSPDRPGYMSLELPDLDAYDLALKQQYKMLKSTVDYLSQCKDAMNSTQRNTFGGSPFYISMDTFADDIIEGNDVLNIQYVDLYNYYATVYSLLPPRFKRQLAAYYQYSPLERIQHGGLTTLSIFDPHQPTKQRIVQAESAVISHSTKQMHDVGLAIWRERVPLTASDKFGEVETTNAMREVYDVGLKLHKSGVANIHLDGADYFSFDSTINPIELNDAYYNVLRQNLPGWYVYWIVDPYYLNSLQMPTWLPGEGTRRTTGIKSGQQITNQGDSFTANFCDLYELIRWSKDTGGKILDEYIKYRLINGDDRYKVAPFGAQELEKYDLELGQISQAAKQEIFSYRDNKPQELKVTYLKTLSYIDNAGKFRRTASECGAILGRYTRERTRLEPAPASLIVETLMSSNRLDDHPDLTALYNFLDSQPIGHLWLNHQYSTAQLTAAAAMEELQALAKQKGKEWLKRTGTDVDSALQHIYNRYGMTPGNYNFQSSYANEKGTLAFDALPVVKRLLCKQLTKE